MSQKKSSYLMNWSRLKELMREYPGGRKEICRQLGITLDALNQSLHRKDMNLTRFLDICEILEQPPHTFIPRNHPPKKP